MKYLTNQLFYKYKNKNNLILKEKEIRNLKPNEVLVKIQLVAICRTDLHIIDEEINANYPIVPEH